MMCYLLSVLVLGGGLFRPAEELVRGRDGVGVYAYAVLPMEDVRRPTVVMRTPYIRNSAYGDATNRAVSAEMQADWLPEWALVRQHCRGRGASEGLFSPYVSEREDGLALLDWVRRLPSYDGRIFLSGVSYGSSVHFAYLNTDPKDVIGACLAVQDCRRYNIIFRNGFFKIGLTGNWYKNNYHNKVPGRIRDGTASQAEFPLIDWSRRFFGAAEPSFDKPLLHPRADDPFWTSDDPDAGRDYGEALAKSTMPVLLRTGFYDIYTEGMFDMWRAMTPERRANCALIVDAYDHGGEVQDAFRGTSGEFPNGGRGHFGKAECEWREWCLDRREDCFTGFKKGMTTYYALWENKWYTEPELQDGLRKVTLPLSGAPSKVSYVYDPRRALPDFPGSGGICFGGMQLQPEPDFRDDVKSFVLPPLAERLDVRGRMTARLTVGSDCEDTCFYVRVSVRKPDGGWYLLRDDITSLCYVQGVYVPGTERTLDYRFSDHAFRLEKGDVLRVDVSSASAAFAPHPNVTGNPNLCRAPRIAHNFVLPHKSSLVLPVRVWREPGTNDRAGEGRAPTIQGCRT